MTQKTTTKDFANSIGNCGLCSNAADGGCSLVEEMIRAAGLAPEEARAAIADRIETEQSNEAPVIGGQATG